jgi:hypothetical protein
MTSQSLSKTPEEAGFKSQDREESPSRLEDTWSQLKLKSKLKSFAHWVTGDNKSPVIREIAGTISCMAIIAYVSGYTFGTWVHKLNNQLTKKINDTINRTV